MSKKYTEEEIRILAHSAIGKTFGELQEMDVKTVKSEDYDENLEVFNKAFFGHIFENNVYKYGSNSISAPDFEDAGIE